jgi:hypothetical protein
MLARAKCLEVAAQSRTAGENPQTIILRAATYWDWVGLSAEEEAAPVPSDTPRKRTR